MEFFRPPACLFYKLCAPGSAPCPSEDGSTPNASPMRLIPLARLDRGPKHSPGATGSMPTPSGLKGVMLLAASTRLSGKAAKLTRYHDCIPSWQRE